MSTKKFIISISCALAVLLVLSLFTLGFVSSKSHRAALLGTWVDSSTDDNASITITFNSDDTYKMTSIILKDGALVPEMSETEGTFSVFNGKIKLTAEDGEKIVLTYSFDSEMREIDVDNYSKTNL